MIEDRSDEVLRYRRSGVAVRIIGLVLVAASVALFVASGSVLALIFVAAMGAAWILLGVTLTVTADRSRQVLTIERSPDPTQPA